MRKAEVARGNNNLTLACREYARIIEDIRQLASPPAAFATTMGEALVAIGDLHHASGQVSKALAFYQEAMRLMNVPEHTVRLIVSAYADRLELSPEAIDAYAVYLRSHPDQSFRDDPVLNLMRSRCEVDATTDLSKLQAIISFTTWLTSFDLQVEWPYFSLGVALGRIGNTREAIAPLLQAERLEPTCAATPFHLGTLYLAQGELSLARQAFQRSLRLDPHQPEALWQSAHILVAKAQESEEVAHGALEEAVNSLRRACELDPTRAAYWHLLGWAELLRGCLEEARNGLSHAATIEPDNFEYQMSLADLLVKQGDSAAAAVALRRALHLAPHNLLAHLRMADLLVAEEQFAEAEKHYREVLRIEPAKDVAHTGLARSVYGQKRWGEAIAEFRQIRGLGKEELYLLGRAFSHSGMPDEAAKTFRDWLNKYGIDVDVWFYLGCAYSQSGNWAQALGAFTQAMGQADATDQARSDVHLYRAIALMQLGQLNEAAVACDIAFTLGPNDVQVAYAQGMLALRQHDPVGAWTAFARASSLDRSYAAAYFGLGVVEERAGDLEKAIQAYKKGLSLDPDWAPARVRLGVAQAKTRNWTSAVEALQGTLERDVENDERSFYLGLAQAQLGRYEDALAAWGSLRIRHPDDSVLADNVAIVHYHLGRRCFEAGDWDGAVAYWQRCHESCPAVAEFRECLVEALVRLGVSTLHSDMESEEARTCARRMLEQAASLEPSDTRPRYYLGLIAAADGNPDLAVEYLQLLVEDDPDDCRYRYHLASTLLAKGDVETAASLLEQLDSVAGPFRPRIEVARGNIAILQGRWAEALDSYLAALQPAT